MVERPPESRGSRSDRPLVTGSSKRPATPKATGRSGLASSPKKTRSRSSTAPSKTPALEPSKVLCPEGHHVEGGQKFCGECGAPVAAAPATPATTIGASTGLPIVEDTSV